MPSQPEQAHNGVCLERIGCGRRLVPAVAYRGDSNVYTDRFLEFRRRELSEIIDGNALERWERHRRGRPAIPLGDIARMVSAVNRTSDARFCLPCPLGVLHGIADSLVPASDALEWVSCWGGGPVRRLLIPGAAHDIFRGKGLNS